MGQQILLLFNCAQHHQSGCSPYVTAVDNVGINAEIKDLHQCLSTSGTLGSHGPLYSSWGHAYQEPIASSGAVKETGRIVLNAPGVWREAARIFSIQQGCFRASGSLSAHLPLLVLRKAALGLLLGQCTQVKEWRGCKKKLLGYSRQQKSLCF